MSLTFTDRKRVREEVDKAARYRVLSHQGQMEEAKRVAARLEAEMRAEQDAKWTKQDVLDAYLRDRERLGRPLMRQDWEKQDKKKHPTPPREVVDRLYGSWAGLVLAAGDRVAKVPGWTDEDIRQAWEDICAIIGHTPTRHEFRDLKFSGYRLPGVSTVQRHYGGWVQFVEKMEAKCYTASSGAYSDYGICAIYEKRETAEKWVNEQNQGEFEKRLDRLKDDLRKLVEEKAEAKAIWRKFQYIERVEEDQKAGKGGYYYVEEFDYYPGNTLPAPGCEVRMTFLPCDTYGIEGYREMQEPYELEMTECFGCGGRPTERHHVVRKSHIRAFPEKDWVQLYGRKTRNLLPLCGECHRRVTENEVKILYPEDHSGYRWVGLTEGEPVVENSPEAMADSPSVSPDPAALTEGEDKTSGDLTLVGDESPSPSVSSDFLFVSVPESERQQEEPHPHDDLKPGERCPGCKRRMPYPPKNDSPVTKVVGMRVPVDEVESVEVAWSDFAEKAGMFGDKYWRKESLVLLLALGNAVDETTLKTIANEYAGKKE